MMQRTNVTFIEPLRHSRSGHFKKPHEMPNRHFLTHRGFHGNRAGTEFWTCRTTSSRKILDRPSISSRAARTRGTTKGTSNFLLVSGNFVVLTRWSTLQMPNSLPLPPELNILLEKRDESDRREDDRRQEQVAVENDQRGRAPRRQRKRRSDDRQ